MATKQNIQGPVRANPAGRTQTTAPKAKVYDKNNTPTQEPASFLTRYSQIFIVSGIALLTFLFYKACLDNKLTNWDDLGYIITNSLIKDTSADAIKNIFSTDHPVMGNYHPLTILLYYFEYGHYGLEPWIYHFDSVILHVLVTIVVYFFIKVLTGRTVAATVVALLFGLHPMHVESVAWAAGRKDVLYGLFFLLSCTTYVWYLRSTGTRKTIWYVMGLVLFTLSLLSKSVAVSLPVTLFAIDYLEKREWSFMWIAEKIPHFGLSVLFGVLSVIAQKNIGAMTLDAHFNPLERFALGCYALCNYLWKAIVPAGLSNFYPYPLKVNDSLPAGYYVYPLIIIGLAVAVFVYARKNRAVIFGLGFFLINIVLLLQFIPVGGAIISDRYGYIPYLGLFFIAGWFISEYFEGTEKIQTGKILLGIITGYSLVLGFVTNERCKDWYDSVTLWKDDIEKHPEAPVGYFYLGQEYFTRYELATNATELKMLGDSSMYCFNQSVQRKPDYINPIICIAEMQRKNNQIEEAKKTYHQALKINDKNESIYLGLGVVYAIQKQYDSADYAFKKAIAIKPFLPEGYSNYANFLDLEGKVDSAVIMFGVAISQNPDAYIPYLNRGRIYYRQQKYDIAIKDLNKALDINHESGETYYMRALTYSKMGNKAQALLDVAKAKSYGFNKIDPALEQSLK